MELNASEPLMRRRNELDDVKTKVPDQSWEESGGHLFTVQAASGVQAVGPQIRLHCGPQEPVVLGIRECRKRWSRERLRTDTGHWGGASRSSEEDIIA